MQTPNLAQVARRAPVRDFVGVDVGKGTHHAVALDRKGKRLLDSALPNDETKLRALIGKLKEHGQILLVVDQPATVGALPVAASPASRPDQRSWQLSCCSALHQA